MPSRRSSLFSIAKRGFFACAAAAFLTFAAPSAVRAQTSPFLPDDLYRTLVNEISGDRAYENVRHLSHFHRTEGSKDFFAATEWVLQAAKDGGPRGREAHPPEVRQPRLVLRLRRGVAGAGARRREQARRLRRSRGLDRRQQPHHARRRRARGRRRRKQRARLPGQGREGQGGARVRLRSAPCTRKRYGSAARSACSPTSRTGPSPSTRPTRSPGRASRTRPRASRASRTGPRPPSP